MAPIDDLLNSIFEGKKPAFYPDFERWVRESRRFRVFATAHESKIRSKLRNVRDEAGMKDLRAELETAAILLREDRFTLEYEKYAALKQRGPDFTVTFKTHTPFNVEVRRVRSVELEEDDAQITKLLAVLCDKVGQMPPGIVNILWLIGEREISEDDLNRTMVTLRQLAERKVEAFFTRRGFKDAADFLRQFRHLSAIILWQHPVIVWENSLAKHKSPPEILTAIQKLSST